MCIRDSPIVVNMKSAANNNKGRDGMSKVMYQWATKKTEGGFAYVASKFTYTEEPQPNGQYGITEILKTSGACRTRARAKSAGIKACRYYKHVQA